jgi:hypothetical protein
MERRKAITMAAAASFTLLAGAGGIALNSGIVRVGGHDKVGSLSPVSTGATAPITVYVTDPNVPTVSPTPSVQPTTATAVTASSGSAVSSGDRHDDDSHGEHDDDHGQKHEGAADDD